MLSVSRDRESAPEAQRPRVADSRQVPSEHRALRKDLEWQHTWGIKPERLELEWDIPEDQLNDVFFQHQFESLTSHIKRFANVFKAGNIPLGDSVWGMDTSDNNAFLQHIVSTIARPDPMDPNPWDDLMKCEDKRICVMRGAIMRIFTDQILNSEVTPVFGADEEQTRTIRHLDESFIQDEGFRRTELNSNAVRMLLGHTRGIPPNFWTGVDKLTLKVLITIIPVLNWVRRTWPPEDKIPDMQMIYGLLHHNVAFAAWISVMTRLSKNVIKHSWLKPGTPYHPDQTELHPALQTKSHRNNIGKDCSQILPPAVDQPSGSKPPKPPTRQARVMISVVPHLTAYELSGSVNARGEPVGHIVTVLAEPQVVYYQGLEDVSEDNALFRTSLIEHSMSLGPKWRPRFPKFALMLVMRFARRTIRAAFELIALLLVVVALWSWWPRFWELVSQRSFANKFTTTPNASMVSPGIGGPRISR